MTQTDATERFTTPHSWVIKCDFNPVYSFALDMAQRSVMPLSHLRTDAADRSVMPLSHLRTDAADRSGCSLRRDPLGIRTV